LIVFRKSIRYELSKYIVISMFFFLTAVLIFSFQFLGRFFSKNAESHAMTILHETDSKIDSFFDEIERLSESLVNYSAVYELRTDEMKELFVANVAARKKYLRAVYLGTKEGEMFEWGVGEGFKDHTPTFPEGYNPVLRPWYRKGYEEGKYAVTDPYIYASIQKLGITSVNPVYDEEGEFVGILGIDIMLESMRDFIDDIEVEKEGRIILMTGEGEIIASQLDELDKEKASSLNEILTKTLSGNLTERTGSFIGSSGGENYYFAYVRNTLTGWNLSIVYPYDSITRDIKNVITMISSVYFVLIILLFITLVSLSRIIIIGPLEELFSVMKKIEAGEKNVRVNINTSNEFGVIGDQFNRLIDVIRDYSESLEKKVEERTSEVIKLQKENTRLRIIEEKERILQDLHDSIGAKLTNINICNNVLYAIEGEDNQLQREEMLQRISENCSTAIRELREITVKDRDLFTETLTDYIENRMKKRLELKNIDLKVKWKVKKDLFALSVEPEAEKELVNIFKELISNVLKHSEAGKVFLILGKEKNCLIITFSDDGVGIGKKNGLASGSGVRNIRKRMRSIRGTAEFEPGKNKGLKVILKFPPISMS
jgi:methyl-accepting chemotaxis protein